VGLEDDSIGVSVCFRVLGAKTGLHQPTAVGQALFSFRHGLRGVEKDFGDGAQSFGEGGESFRDDHEFLEIDGEHPNARRH